MSAHATLAHDVGKYIARIARNVPETGAFPGALVPLLAKDLYEAPGGGRPSARFAALAAELPPHAALEEAAAHLRAIDALEGDVRGGDEAACREACRRALAVERLLRGYAAEGA